MDFKISSSKTFFMIFFVFKTAEKDLSHFDANIMNVFYLPEQRAGAGW